jgi:uncharacterized protein with NRDE domain
MCLLFFSYQKTPGYKLVLAANRDEFLCRPTAPLDFLDKEKTILAGRDLQGGGTWLGITGQLKFAAITNYREPAKKQAEAPSRGEILLNYLMGEIDACQYVHSLAENGNRYNGFNLIVGDRENIYYYSNKSVGPKLLAPGFYGLSNHLLDVPWPKVVRGKNLLFPNMVNTDRLDPMQLFSILEDTRKPTDNQLPDTGIGLEWERLLSTIFIDGNTYGTRSSAVITVSDSGDVQFIEKSIKRASSKDITSEFIHHSMKGSSRLSRPPRRVSDQTV